MTEYLEDGEIDVVGMERGKRAKNHGNDWSNLLESKRTKLARSSPQMPEPGEVVDVAPSDPSPSGGPVLFTSDFASVAQQRIDALKSLEINPDDVSAKKRLSFANEQVRLWAQTRNMHLPDYLREDTASSSVSHSHQPSTSGNNSSRTSSNLNNDQRPRGELRSLAYHANWERGRPQIERQAAIDNATSTNCGVPTQFMDRIRSDRQPLVLPEGDIDVRAVRLPTKETVRGIFHDDWRPLISRQRQMERERERDRVLSLPIGLRRDVGPQITDRGTLKEKKLSYHVSSSPLPFERRRPWDRHDRRRSRSPPSNYHHHIVEETINTKHPVSALQEVCSKKKWGPPTWDCQARPTPRGFPAFLWTVTVKGTPYQPEKSCGNKKLAKAQAAQVALQNLGLIPSADTKEKSKTKVVVEEVAKVSTSGSKESSTSKLKQPKAASSFKV